MGGRITAIACVASLAWPLVAGAQATHAGRTPPTFSAATNVVEVDTEVDDAAGHFVDGLTAADFRVAEDGRPQTIQQFYLVRNGQRVVPHEPASAPAPGATQAAPARPPARLFVVIFDNDHLTAAGLKKAKEAATDLFSKHLQTGDVGGVVSDGQLAGNHLTGDRDALLKAVDAARPTTKVNQEVFELREWPDMSEAEAVEIVAQGFQRNKYLDETVARVCGEEPEQCTMADPRMMVYQKAQQVTALVRDGSDRVLSEIAALMNGLGRFEGRKTILLLSEGFVADESWPLVRDAIGQAARANARIYSLDVRGLQAREFGEFAPQEDSLSRLLTSFDTGADSINSLAVDTGGYVVRNTNLFDKAVAEIADEAGTYYVLGYRADRPPDGKFRKISVTVGRPGLKVRARRGYVATPVVQATEAAAPTPPKVVVWNTNIPGTMANVAVVQGGVRIELAGPPPFGGTTIDLAQQADGEWVSRSSTATNCAGDSSWRLRKEGQVLLLEETCADETAGRGRGITVVMTMPAKNPTQRQ